MKAEAALSELLSAFARTLLTDIPGQSALDHLVERIADVLPISAAGVTLLTPEGQPIYAAASNDQALRLEQLQGELGEGPSRLVFSAGTSVLAPDLATDVRLPKFGPLAVADGVSAVFSFPLCEGGTILGALSLYVVDAGQLRPRHQEIAQTLADVAAAYTINATARGDLRDAVAAARHSEDQEVASARALRASARSNRRAGVALDASEARNTAILASALDAVITVDDQGRVVDFNAAAERILGYRERDVSGRSLADLIAPADERDAHRQRWEGLLENHDEPPFNSRLECTAMRADGTLFPAEVSTHVVVGPGSSFVTGFLRDLTAEKEASTERADLEAQLHQSQRLESLGRLAGGVAHDFNNLLTVIIGFASSIAEASPQHTVTQEQAQAILDASARAARLTHQLLTFARRQPVRYEAVDLNGAVTDIQPLLTQTLGDGVRLLVDLDSGLPPIHGDRGQTDQLLLNLAGNARDAMPDGGALTVRTRLTSFDENHPRVRRGMAAGEYVELSIADTGEGMSPDVAAQAFDPFFTTRSPGRNSGLGLATVHGIVNEAGGTVELLSESGSGTTVTALFPVDRSTTPVAGPRGGEDGSHGETILVVEDEPAVLDVTAMMLRRRGYVALEAITVADAVAVFDRNEVDLLLTDVVMPESSGRELADALQAKNDRLAVLFMSGSIGDAFGAHPRLPPDLALLQKPFDAAALASAVADALRDRPEPRT